MITKRPSSNNCPITEKKEAKINALVIILIRHPVLLIKWSEFSDELECPAQDKLRWDRGIHNCTLHYYDLFSEMLDDWVERNSNKMTVQDLCRVLRGIECVSVAEELESDFNKDEIIQKLSAKRNVFLQNRKANWPLKHGLSVPTGSPTTEKKEVKINALVRILEKHPVLLIKWSQFSDELECPAQDKLRWDRGIHNCTLHYYDLFSEMLDDWVERNSNKMTVQNLCRVLRGIECVYVAEKLESDFNKDEIIQKLSAKRNVFLQNRKVNWPLKHGLSVPTENFAGREEQLQEIKDNFNSKNNLMLITGFGGIGKTELCRKFAHNICKSVFFRVQSCVWLHGKSYETLRDSVLKLANELGITNEANPPVSEYFEFIASFILGKSSRLVLVIDNVDVLYAEFIEFIKIVKMTKNEKMFVIVTSRDSNILEGAGITMKLDVLSKSNSRRMLQNSMGDLTDSDADKMSELVQYFPLALQQAVAYIKEQRKHFRTANYSVTDYVNEFEVKKSQMLGHKLNELEHDYIVTTLVTWDMTICKMSNNANEILKIIAYLDPDGVKLDFFEKVCTQMGVVDFDNGLDLLINYCLVKIDKVVSVHRLVQEVMRGKVDIDDYYIKTLFDCVFLVRWELFGDSILLSSNVHLRSVFKFAWKCEMQQRLYSDSEALLFLLNLDRIECADKLTKLKYPEIEFSSKFGVEKREFLEKVLLWSVVCRESRTNSKEIAKGEFNVDWQYVNDHLYLFETIEGCLQISQKYFGESSKITFAVKNVLVRELLKRRSEEFDRALSLCEELADFPFEDDDGQANLLYKTINYIFFDLEQEYTPSQLASLEKIINKIVKTDPNYSIERMKLETHWCDLKGDYKKALEVCTKLVQEGNPLYENKRIELRIKLTDFDKITVEEFVSEFGGVDFEKHYYLRLRGLENLLEIYESNLGSVHKLTIKVKLAMARKLQYGNTTEKREKCIELCEQILRSKFDERYEDAFEFLCSARNIQKDFDEHRKILQNLLDSKWKELGNDHSNTKVVLDLLRQLK